MDLGQWSKAMIRAIVFMALPVIVYFSYEAVLNDHGMAKLMASSGIILVSTIAYFLVSFAGWWLFGYPVHWVAVHYFNRSVWCYVVAVLIVIAIIGVFAAWGIAWIFALFIAGQAAIFFYFVRQLSGWDKSS